MILTPKNKRTVFWLWLVTVVAELFLLVLSYRYTLYKYGFALDAEKITRLVTDLFPRWPINAALDFFLIWLALRAYPGQVSIFYYRPTRPYWSLAWAIVFGIVMGGKIYGVLSHLVNFRFLYLAVLTISVYVIGCARCGVTNSNLFAKENIAPNEMT